MKTAMLETMHHMIDSLNPHGNASTFFGMQTPRHRDIGNTMQFAARPIKGSGRYLKFARAFVGVPVAEMDNAIIMEVAAIAHAEQITVRREVSEAFEALQTALK